MSCATMRVRWGERRDNRVEFLGERERSKNIAVTTYLLNSIAFSLRYDG